MTPDETFIDYLISITLLLLLVAIASQFLLAGFVLAAVGYTWGGVGVMLVSLVFSMFGKAMITSNYTRSAFQLVGLLGEGKTVEQKHTELWGDT